ncbi:hypothetical protein D3C87_1568700 [compost metagenome]
MGFPGRAARLLVQVHAEDIGAAELARFGDQADPRRVVTQDVADDQLAAMLLGSRNDALCVGDRRCQRLLHEDVAARFEGGDRIVGMAVGIGADRAELGLQVRKRRREIRMDFVAAKLFRKLDPGAVDQADDLEAGIVVVGERMAAPHVAEPRDEDPDRFHF